MHFLVFNPMAGRGRARRALAAAERYLAERRLPYRVLTTTRRAHATELVRDLPRDALVIAIGGDGTAHEVGVACVGTDRTLAVLPSGSGDDFAFALGLDRHDLSAALEVLAHGTPRWVDVGTVNGTPFLNATGAGFDADVAALVHGAPGMFRGLSAYLYALVRAMKDFSLVDVAVDVDGARVHDGPALLVTAQNGPRSGGSFLFSPDARLDDGRLDVLIGGSFSRLGTLAILPALMKGQHLSHPEVKLVRGSRATFTWSAPRTYHMEGEVEPARRVFEVEVLPKGLRVLAPAG